MRTSCYPLLFLFLFPLFAEAQLEKLSRDEDISWIARAETLLGFDASIATPPPRVHQLVPLKVVQQPEGQPSRAPFTEALRRLIEEGQLPAFADARLQQPLAPAQAKERLSLVDTMVTFDPETYEEQIIVIRSELLEGIEFFKVQQLWYYDSRDKAFRTRALAIAPTLKMEQEDGTQKFRALLWYKLPPAKKKLFRLKNRSLKFATYLSYDIPERKMTNLKGEDKPLKEWLFEHFLAGEIRGYNQSQAPIPASEASEVFVHQDTIITFDPETYEETVEVITQEFHPEDVVNYRIQQSWFFDPESGILQSRAEAVAPAISVTDEYGTQLFLEPLFFWRRSD